MINKNNQLNVLIVLKFLTSEQLCCQVQSILLKTVLAYEALANAVVSLVCPHHGSYEFFRFLFICSSSWL